MSDTQISREANKQAEIESHAHSLALAEPHTFRRPFGRPWSTTYWTKWATIAYALQALEIPDGARVLDVGCGAGWTTAFLAESGYSPVGFDIAPAMAEMGRRRAERWEVDAEFMVADMDGFSFEERFDAILVFDALHHSKRQTQVVANIASHLKPGGWVLFGEPSWLHGISPDARKVSAESGWIERGIRVGALRRDCRAAGMPEQRRFFEGTAPYASRLKGWLWQLTRLSAANVAVAPQASIWLAARKAPTP